MSEKREFSRRSERIEELVTRIESSGDPAMRAVAQELLQAVIELHGVALERILDSVATLPHGVTAVESMAQDDLVSNVLSLHGINPLPMGARVAAGLEKAQQHLEPHGASVMLDSIEGGTVHVTIQGAQGCHASSMRDAVEDAIVQAAPEIVTIIAEERPAPPQLVQLAAPAPAH